MWTEHPAFVRTALLLAFALLGCNSGEEGVRRPGSGAASDGSSEQAGPDVAGGPRAGLDEGESRGTIGVAVLTLANPFFRELADSFSDEAQKYGYETVVVSSDNDPAKQQHQVKDFIVQQMSAIVLTPCDSRGIGAAIREANEAGIPVFTADIACLDPKAKVVAHVATDNYGGGREAAKAMIEAIGGQGKVAIIDYPEVESVILRVRGFQDELDEAREKSGVDIEIVARLPGGGDREKSYKAAQDLLQAHGDLAGIFAINDPSALGAAAALEKLGISNQVQIIGFDGQLDGKRAIRDGLIYADPIQFPDRIGRQTMQTIIKYLNGEEFEAELLIPTRLYRKSDAEKDPDLS